MNKIIDPKVVQERLALKLHNFNAAKTLAYAWNAGENVILFGPGGYGKSEAALEFADLLYEQGLVNSPKAFVRAFNQGLTEEILLGGVDIKTLNEEGKINYLLENAFVNSEIVIFEEMFDAFPSVLLTLKDILTSKKVRMGNQEFPIKTRIVICCTNRSRDEVVEDNSTAALMERFVFEKWVGWTSHTATDYYYALMKQPNADRTVAAKVADVCANVSTGEYVVSPRTAFKAYKSAKLNGIDSLEDFYGFNSAVGKFLSEEKEIEEISSQKTLLRTYEKFSWDNQPPSEEMLHKQSAISQLKKWREIVNVRNFLLNMKVHDQNVNYRNELAESLAFLETRWLFLAKITLKRTKGNQQFPKGSWRDVLEKYEDINVLKTELQPLIHV